MQANPSNIARRDGLFWTVVVALFIASIWGTVRLCDVMSGNDMRMPGGWMMSMAWMRMPGQTWTGALLSFISMWTVMMVAMMLPCLAPMLAAYRRSATTSAVDICTAIVGIGYFSIWAMLGTFVYAVGVPIAYAQMRCDALSELAPIVTAVIVLLAGVSQFTHWKMRLLRGCRSECRPGDSMPAQGCRHGTRDAAFDAFRHGLRLGVHCGKCCAGYMLILLVTNVMSLPIMAAVTVAITAERLLPHPTLVARLTGTVTVVVGMVMLARVI